MGSFVDRLRVQAAHGLMGVPKGHRYASFEDAANIIEGLDNALRQIIDDCEAEYPPSHGAIKQFAKMELAKMEETQND